MPKTKKNNSLYCSPERRVLNVLPTNIPKGKGKQPQSKSNWRPLRTRRISKKLDFRGEEEFFNEPASIVQNDLDSFMEFETILSPAVPVYIDNESDAKEVGFTINISLTIF